MDNNSDSLLGRRDYTTREVEATRQVLAELMELLEEYRHGIVLIGGSVPYFAIPNPKTPHKGTKDLDFVLDPEALREDGDESIEEILTKALYQKDDKGKAFRWYKRVLIDGEFVEVILDFLTGETANYANGRLQIIQDIHASTMRGCEAAFLDPVDVPIETRKTDGSSTTITFRMASVPQFLVMKGLALHNRDEMAQKDNRREDDASKDAYDIYFIVKNYPGGLTALADKVKPILNEPLAQESFQKIANKWRSPKDRGPILVAKDEINEDEQKRLQRDVYEQVRELLVQLTLV